MVCPTFSHSFSAENALGIKEEEDILLASVPVVQKDLMNALEKLHSKFAEAIGAPKVLFALRIIHIKNKGTLVQNMP